MLFYMENELKDIKFKYPFRDYQKETLTMLEKYLHDEKIHIVAAPGAGKTILALELLLRIGNKALILVPTIAIKEQWIERLKKDFINGDKENLISTEIENPKTITVDTYQALYALNKKETDIAKIITENNIKTIILDEAHHLRKVWQRTLKKVIDNLKECTTISLTATPPYDNDTDFKNYMDLCGMIDAKITIPQLVKSNCLCPHQDFIYFNIPTAEQEKTLLEYTKKVNAFVKELLSNQNFIKIIALHDYIIDTDSNTNNILNEFDVFVAMLSFLKEVKYEIPDNVELKKLNIPKLNFSILNILLEKIIFDNKTLEQEIFKEEIKSIKQKLLELECIDEDNNINLKYSKKVSNLLTRNYEKLNSICEIIDIEKKSLQEKLKLVVVTDYIKDEYYDIENEEEIKELGVLPIFRKVTAKCQDVKVGVLTGTVIIIPTELKDKLLELAEKEYNIPRESIKIKELGMNFEYSNVVFENKYDRFRVNLITKLFENSNISVLIGTIALIGEGWDAPFVNSLIMATYVSSFVTSNQLRGRAIRINKKDPTKFSNIWHLICFEKEADKYVLGYDYEILNRRFFAFEGIDIENKSIYSGIDRLNIENKKYSKEEIESLNNYIIEKSRNRIENTEIWKGALTSYVPITTDKTSIPKNIIELKQYNPEKDYIPAYFIFSIFGFIYSFMLSFSVVDFNNPFKVLLTIWSGYFTLVFGMFAHYFINFKLHRNYNYFVKSVCKAVYKALIKKKIISPKTKYFIKKVDEKLEYGLIKGSTYEQMMFLKTIKEAFEINTESRYIVEFADRACAVPVQFDKNKEEARIFQKLINTKFSRLTYTKSEKGKRILLQYKLQLLGSDDTKKIN